MKTTVYCATSIDGFIATKDGDSDWVSRADTPYFEAEIKNAACIVIGGKTFRQFEGDLFPVKDIVNIVLTSDTGLAAKYPGSVFTATSPKEIIKLAKEKGYENILLVGGGNMNGAFLREGLIDEVIVDIHPLILGDGIKLFENAGVKANFEKISEQVLEDGLVLVKYKKI